MVTMLIYFNLAQNWTQNPFAVKFILAMIKIKVYLIHFGRIYNRLGVNVPLHFLWPLHFL